MKKPTILISIMAFSLMFSSCFHHEIEGNMHSETETRQIGNFEGIKSEGNYNVTFYQSAETKVVIEAESNILPYIQTVLDGDVLEIKTRDNRNFDNNLPIYVSVYGPVCNSVFLSGSGRIQSDSISSGSLSIKVSGSGDINCNVFANYLKTDISGSGDIDLEGISDESDFLISGSGTISSYNLIQKKCFASVSGSGSMYVSVSDLLDVKISGSGKIFYKGNPTINTSITGSGSVVNKN